MRLRIYQVDAFTDRLFGGNPAAVVLMPEWPSHERMQQIAAENNLSETAFLVRNSQHYEIRWFTPATEVDLCGHATLASGYVLFNLERIAESVVELDSRSGVLKVRRDGDMLTLDFPADTPVVTEIPARIAEALGARPLAAFKGKSDYLLIFENQEEIERIVPDFGLLASLPARGIIVSAKGDNADFVSRFFAPRVGVNEDPVTGSAHTLLTPFWSARLGKNELYAEQLSRRRGKLTCRLEGARVEISGRACPYLDGWIEIPDFGQPG